MVECVPVDNKFIKCDYGKLKDVVGMMSDILPSNVIQDVKNDYVEFRFSPPTPKLNMQIVSALIFYGFTHIEACVGCIRAFFDDEQSLLIWRYN